MKTVGIDTVTLLLPANKVALLEPARFTPNATRVLGASNYDLGRGKYLTAVCNPFKKDTQEFGYLPYLTLYVGLRGGGLSKGLRVQYSAPKLIRGNNFDETSETDFEPICQLILDGLAHYKVRVWGGIETIKDAQCQVVHYSKNFALPYTMTSNQVLREIRKCDVNAWKATSEDKYSNGGHGYKTHTKHYELAFYDKVAEYFKGKRGQPHYDEDITQLSFDLFKDVERKKIPEVFRMEVRLGNPRTIKTALKNARLPPDDISFRTLFSSSYSQQILQHQLDDYYSRYPKIASADAENELELLSDLFVQNPNRHMSTILAAIGLYTLNQQSGMRELKDIVGVKGVDALHRLSKKADKELRYKTAKPEVFELLRAELKKFRPVYLADFFE